MRGIEIDDRLPGHPAFEVMTDRDFRALFEGLSNGLFPPPPFDPNPIKVTSQWLYFRVDYKYGDTWSPLLRCRPLDWGGDRERPAMPTWLRDQILERDGAWCAYCGSTELLHIDHIHPWSKGGDFYDPANLQVLCRTCNCSKGARLPEDT